MGAPIGAPKIIAFEGEFAMCAGHAQELKTQAIALQNGKRLRVFFSDNNAGIDDALIGGVVNSKFDGYTVGWPTRENSNRSSGLMSVTVPTVERGPPPRRFWSTITAVDNPSMNSTSGLP